VSNVPTLIHSTAIAGPYSRGLWLQLLRPLTTCSKCTNQDLFILFICILCTIGSFSRRAQLHEWVICILYTTSPDSSVSLVTSLWIERAGHRCSKPGGSKRLLPSSQNSDRLWRPTPNYRGGTLTWGRCVELHLHSPHMSSWRDAWSITENSTYLKYTQVVLVLN
jgi:hypothetical protein